MPRDMVTLTIFQFYISTIIIDATENYPEPIYLHFNST